MPVLIVLLLGIAWQGATIIDVVPYTQHQGSAARDEIFTLAVEIGDMIYSADFRVSRRLKSADFNVGERVQATVENGKITVRRRDGKTATGKIIGRERIVLRPRYCAAPRDRHL